VPDDAIYFTEEDLKLIKLIRDHGLTEGKAPLFEIMQEFYKIN
jgi:hypothetical protein